MDSHKTFQKNFGLSITSLCLFYPAGAFFCLALACCQNNPRGWQIADYWGAAMCSLWTIMSVSFFRYSHGEQAFHWCFVFSVMILIASSYWNRYPWPSIVLLNLSSRQRSQPAQH